MPKTKPTLTPTPKPKALTPKQELFVQEYLVDLNGAAAYRRAGYSVKSENTATVNASRLLSNAKVQAAVKLAMDERAKRVAVTQDYVIRMLQDEAEFHGEGSSHAARIRAIELLGKHLGMFRDKSNDQDGGDEPITILNYVQLQPGERKPMVTIRQDDADAPKT